ncbi:hypothetical protein KUD11_06560 [Roseovarius sp. LXJ103]|nr:hypothetical protein [Roseovarius carneus]MBZ8118307.1 hypothetical protein [Roseovarius carneus]
MTFDLLFAGLVSLLVITALIVAITGPRQRGRKRASPRMRKDDPKR